MSSEEIFEKVKNIIVVDKMIEHFEQNKILNS